MIKYCGLLIVDVKSKEMYEGILGKNIVQARVNYSYTS